MIKVYLNNKAYWFDSLKQAEEFIYLNPLASFKEFSEYWDAKARKWLQK